jgi:hypothetical protein
VPGAAAAAGGGTVVLATFETEVSGRVGANRGAGPAFDVGGSVLITSGGGGGGGAFDTSAAAVAEGAGAVVSEAGAVSGAGSINRFVTGNVAVGDGLAAGVIIRGDFNCS